MNRYISDDHLLNARLNHLYIDISLRYPRYYEETAVPFKCSGGVIHSERNHEVPGT
jgi:hypothetical protein